MPIWKRLLVTSLAMVIASCIAGLPWRGMFDVRIPSYLSGLIGGVCAHAVREILRSRPKRQDAV